jgi:hypothetical protein
MKHALNLYFGKYHSFDASVVKGVIHCDLFAPRLYPPLPFAPVTGAVLTLREIRPSGEVPSSSENRGTWQATSASVSRRLCLAMTALDRDSDQRICGFFREIFTQIFCAHKGVVSVVGRNVMSGPPPSLWVVTDWIDGSSLDVTGGFSGTEKRIIPDGIVRGHPSPRVQDNAPKLEGGQRFP